MKRTTGLSLLAGVLFACMSMSSSPQAAPASVNICKSAAVTQCSKHRQRRAFTSSLPLLVASGPSPLPLLVAVSQF